jgi:hypothetical protein
LFIPHLYTWTFHMLTNIDRRMEDKFQFLLISITCKLYLLLLRCKYSSFLSFPFYSWWYCAALWVYLCNNHRSSFYNSAPTFNARLKAIKTSMYISIFLQRAVKCFTCIEIKSNLCVSCCCLLFYFYYSLFFFLTFFTHLTRNFHNFFPRVLSRALFKLECEERVGKGMCFEEECIKRFFNNFAVNAIANALIINELKSPRGDKAYQLCDKDKSIFFSSMSIHLLWAIFHLLPLVYGENNFSKMSFHKNDAPKRWIILEDEEGGFCGWVFFSVMK